MRRRTIVLILVISILITIVYLVSTHHISLNNGSKEFMVESRVDGVVATQSSFSTKEDFERTLKLLFPESRKVSMEEVEEKFGVKVIPPSYEEFKKMISDSYMGGIPKKYWIIGYGYPYKLNLKTSKVEGKWNIKAEMEAENNPNIAQLCITHWFTGDGKYLGTIVEIFRYKPRIHTIYGWFKTNTIHNEEARG